MEPRSTQPHRPAQRDREPTYPRHSHHRQSPIGHWTRTLGTLLPLAITELVPDHAKQVRFIRISSVALAALYQASYAYQLQHERREREEERRDYHR